TNQATWSPDLFPFLTQPFPADTYPLEAPLGYVLTRLGLDTYKTASFHFVLLDTFPRVDLWNDGTETIQVPAGTFECHRVRMRADPQTLFPRLPGLLRPFLSFFVPTYTLWLTTSTPQLIVKYVGQIGPPGSPELRIQLTRVSDTVVEHH